MCVCGVRGLGGAGGAWTLRGLHVPLCGEGEGWRAGWWVVVALLMVCVRGRCGVAVVVIRVAMQIGWWWAHCEHRGRDRRGVGGPWRGCEGRGGGEGEVCGVQTMDVRIAALFCMRRGSSR